MIRKLVFICVISALLLSGIVLIFTQDTSAQTQPEARTRQYDHEFDRLSEEERRRLHMNQNRDERDESMRRANLPIRDDSGVDPARYQERAQTQPRAQREETTNRENVRNQTEAYLRRNYPEMSERELDETIEKMLDQLIEQLEARIERRVRIRLKQQLVSFLERLIKKYKVDPATAEDMTRERARQEIEQIRQQQPQREGESYNPPQNNQQQRANTNDSVETRRQPNNETQRSQTRTRQQVQTRPQTRVRNGRTVQVRNPQRQVTRTQRRPAAQRRTQVSTPNYTLKRFIIGNDKDGLIITKENPTLITITVHTNSDVGKYLYVTFTAVSADDNKEYKIHQSKKFLMLDKRSQYQFYWASEMVGTETLLPNGKYRIKAVAAVHNAQGKVIATPGRFWGGNNGNVSVTARN